MKILNFSTKNNLQKSFFYLKIKVFSLKNNQRMASNHLTSIISKIILSFHQKYYKACLLSAQFVVFSQNINLNNCFLKINTEIFTFLTNQQQIFFQSLHCVPIFQPIESLYLGLLSKVTSLEQTTARKSRSFLSLQNDTCILYPKQ